MVSKNNLNLKCECSSHSIEVSYDEEMKYTEISVWHFGHYNNKLSLKERIRWCFHIMFTGNPWTDMVILNNKSVKKLISWLENTPTKKQLLLDNKSVDK